jgi:hypothetical protein
MASSAEQEFNCSICSQPVELATAKTDDNGKVVHEECYVHEMTLMTKRPSEPIKHPRLPIN